MPSRAPEALSRSPGTVLRTGSLNLRWADPFVAALALSGLRDACVCSGSRSAPLALAFHRSGLRTHVPLDERAGAYFALGLAKASGRPVAVVTTSGTAAANLLPAIVEAYHARVPLIVVTADRPPELRDTGAGQTIDQIKLYGGLVRWFCEVGAPAEEPEPQRYAASLGHRAVAESWGPPAGPVHLNFAFREPLVPEPGDVEPFPVPQPTETPSPPEPPPPTRRMVARIAQALRARRRGIIVCGPEDPIRGYPEAIARLAAAAGYPIFADPASQVRFGPHDRGRVLGAYDALLRAPGFAARQGPEIVVQFGAAPISRSFHQYLALHAEAIHLLVDPSGGWRSPARRAREVIPADPTALALAVAEALEGSADPLPSWSDSFNRAEHRARAVLERHAARAASFEEGALFAKLLPLLSDGGALYVGNSMAIRDLDAFVPGAAAGVRVLANRGANGIDGLISSALGASAALDGPLLAVTGDLSFHHDLTGLHAARDAAAGGRTGIRGADRSPAATIVVVNNDGGGIFSFLPIARHAESFERYFGTPHGLDFAHAAALYGIPFARPRAWGELCERAASSLARRTTQILEVRTDRSENAALHQALWNEIARAVDGEPA